jgi:23S rRNA (guanosine2251-2'-O)-methyltransferase
MSEYISGRNAVYEVLKAGKKQVNKIYVSQTAHGNIIKDIINLARERGIPVHHTPPERLDKFEMENNQGVVAETAPTVYLSLTELWEKVKTETKPLIVILDGIEDPHNLGAIIRNAVVFGAHGLVVGKWRSANLTETVIRTSAGASEHIPIARVTNIAQSISELKELGCWVVGTDSEGKPIQEETFSHPLAVVIGSEGSGLHRLVKERCDTVVAIPQKQTISSLNASCASAVVLYEISRRN